MNRNVKFVALVLAIALLAVPVAALSSCWTSSDESQHGCVPDCAMMATMMATMNAHHSAYTVQAVTSGTSCCDISSGKPNPTTQLQGPTDSSRIAVTPPQSSGTFAAVIVPARCGSPASTPPLPSASPQAVLCTFLI